VHGLVLTFSASITADVPLAGNVYLILHF